MLELGSRRRLILVGGKRDGDRGARSSVSPPHGAWYWPYCGSSACFGARPPDAPTRRVRRSFVYTWVVRYEFASRPPRVVESTHDGNRKGLRCRPYLYLHALSIVGLNAASRPRDG